MDLQQATTVEETATVTPPTEETTPPETETHEANYVIGDKSFRTQAEAFEFAKQALAQKDREIEIADAYRQGIADAAQQLPHQPSVTQPVTQTQEDDEQWNTQFYTNPKKVLEEEIKRTRQAVREEVLNEVTTAQSEEQLWREFFTSHPDLDGYKTDVQLSLATHANEVKALTATKGKKVAMDYLAQKTRAKFTEYAERIKQTRELPNTRTVNPPSTQQVVTQPKSKAEPIDFVTQLRKLKQSRM